MRTKIGAAFALFIGLTGCAGAPIAAPASDSAPVVAPTASVTPASAPAANTVAAMAPVGSSIPAAAVTSPLPVAATDEIENSLLDHKEEFLNCYRHELAAGHRENGRLVASFTIEAQGVVGQAMVKKTTLQAPELDACVVGIIRQIRFPATSTRASNGHLEVSYPFTFRAS